MRTFEQTSIRHGLALISVLAIAALPVWADAEGQRLVLRGGRLIDGVGDAARGDAVLVIEGERIVTVGGEAPETAGARIIDLGGATLLPGLIDAHSHPLISTDGYQVDQLKTSSATKALRGLKAV